MSEERGTRAGFYRSINRLSDRVKRPADDDIVARLGERGINTVVTVPCSITATIDQNWQELELQGKMRVVRATHEGSLVGVSSGMLLGSGELPLIHLQNSGLPDTIDAATTFAQIYDMPYLALVTMRGFGEDSHPHVETAKRTYDMVRLLAEKSNIFHATRGRGFLRALDDAVDCVRDGNRALLLLGEKDFNKTHKLENIDRPEETADEFEARQQWLREKKGRPYRKVRAEDLVTREEMFRAAVDRHPEAAFFVCNGYNSREWQEKLDRLLVVYNPGNMGGTLALGWGFAMASGMDSVVIDGDQNALRSVTTFNLEDFYPGNMYWEIANNRTGSSVGTAPSVRLPEAFYKLARVTRTIPDAPGSFQMPRVGPGGNFVEGEIGDLPDLIRRFRHAVRSREVATKENEVPATFYR